MQTKLSVLTIFLLAMLLAPPASPAPIMDGVTRVQADWGQMPLYFVANQGQIDDDRVAYYVQGRDKTLYFAPNGVTFALTSAESRWVVKLDFVDANPVRPVGQAQTEAVISYFKGPRDEWHTGLPTFSQVVYRDLWEGIDLEYSGTVHRLKYEFVVRPGADPARIRLAYRGAHVRLNEAGQLEVSTPAGGFQDDAPLAYQEVNGKRVPVSVGYVLEDAATSGAGESTYGFWVGAYDPTLPLVIDPAVLVYCGYIGGSDQDTGDDIAVDSAGNAYITGYTLSTEATFPVTVGPDLTHNGGTYWDAFVVKIRADGTGLVYAGYIGGIGDDAGEGITVDLAGNAYVTGDTHSRETSFPVTVGPDLTFNGDDDAFVAKVSADGTGMDYSGYIGGSEIETAYDIAVESAGNAYVAGQTYSSEGTFPATVGPDLTYNGRWDAFVAKVAADGSGLVYAGYIGGSEIDTADGIAVDSEGYAYVAGDTESDEGTFPVTVGPDLTYNDVGGVDAFIAKVKADGSGLVYAGYIGGSEADRGHGIALDGAGYAYVVGGAASSDATFPVVGGPDTTFNGWIDAFVAKVRADGTGLVYCGYIGGSGSDWGEGIAVDPAGNAYITGYTVSNEASFPVTEGPDLTFNGGHSDAFVAKVKADGTGLAYAGYIGGSTSEDGQGIAVDSAGNAYITGYTNSTEATFPETVGPDLTYNGGSSDAFVAKVSMVTFAFKTYLPLILK